MQINASPSFDLPPVVGATRRFLIGIAAGGVVVSLLLFYLVRQEVNLFLTQQLEESVVQAISELQQQANQDQSLIEALAGLLVIYPDVPPDRLRQFVAISDRDESMIEMVYLAAVENDHIERMSSVLKFDRKNTPPLIPEDLEKIDGCRPFGGHHLASDIGCPCRPQ